MKVLRRLYEVYKKEPVRVAAYLTSGVVFVASLFDVVVDPLDVAQYVAVVAAVIGLVEGTRSRVSPK